MKITPIEIEKQEFGISFRGYNPQEVKAFLSNIAHQLSVTLGQMQELREKNLVLEGKMSQIDEYEDHLKSALITASQYTEGAKENARREAEIVIKEAQIEAQRLIAQSKAQLLNMQEEIKLLDKQKYRFLVELRALIQSHSRVLEAQEEVEQLMVQGPIEAIPSFSASLNAIHSPAVSRADYQNKVSTPQILPSHATPISSSLKFNKESNVLSQELSVSLQAEEEEVSELSDELSAALGDQKTSEPKTQEASYLSPMKGSLNRTQQKSGIASLQDVLSKTPNRSTQERVQPKNS
jgi:cell division initiation protein